jgi:serine/threonine-protein kinase
LPAELAAVVARALEKRPAQRYADGDQMARELRAVEAALGARNQGTMPDSSPPVSVSRP